MKRSRKDSRIEVWEETYINNPRIRTLEDRGAKIEQIEPVYGLSFIVEVFNEEEEEDETD